MKWWPKKSSHQHTESIVSKIDSQINISLGELLNLCYPGSRLNLLSTKKVMSTQIGQYSSGLKGRGIDFEEVRSYQPGDDIRLMDWRVTARTGKPHTKVFREERERPVFLIVDQGTNMMFGSRVTFKSSIAAKSAALIAWAAMNNHDKICSFVFNGQEQLELRPRGGKFGVLPLLKILTQTTVPQELPDNPKDFANCLARLRHVNRPGSLIFIFSDFHHFGKTARMHLALLAQHSEVVAVTIGDPLEELPPPPDQYAITNGEHDILLDTRQKQVREGYIQQYMNRQEIRQSFFRRYGIKEINIQTTDDPINKLQLALGEK